MRAWVFKMVFFLTIIGNAEAQQLVPNSGFEDLDQCPPYPGQIHLASHWDSPNHTTTDFFHGCASADSGAGVPANLVGNQEPNSGNGYAGFRAWVPVIEGNPPYREYLTVRLIDSLIQGERYIFSCQICVAESSSFLSDGPGVLLTHQPLAPATHYDASPQLRFPEGVFLDDTFSWIEFKTSYTAEGGERYLTIGNFQPDQKTLLKQISSLPPVVYYYIDDIQLTRCIDSSVSYQQLDTFFCKGNRLDLSAPGEGLAYLWDTGDSTKFISAQKPGRMSVSVFDGCKTTVFTYNVVEKVCDCFDAVSGGFPWQSVLQLSDEIQNASLFIFNSIGQIVGMSDQIDFQKFSINLPSGLYFWTVVATCNGQQVRKSGQWVIAR